MNYYFFNHEKFNRLYNCSMLTTAQWEAYKHPSLIGYAHLGLATLYQVLYLPFLIVMLKDQFFQHSCYKMMFMLGVYDVFATLIGGTFEGIFAIRGDIYCTNPDFIYLVGCFQVQFWVSACCASLLLLFNRSLDLLNKNWADLLFSGRKTYIWCLFPFLWGLWMAWFTTPYLFNSMLHAAFVNPYFGVKEVQVDMNQYDDHYCVIFNYVVAVLFPALYVVLSIVLICKTKGPVAISATVSKVQKQIIIQSIIVSIFLSATAALYMMMQYFIFPEAVVILSQFMWQASHGASVFTYIFVNKSMSKEAIQLLKDLVGKKARINPNPASVHVNPSWLTKGTTTNRTYETQNED